MAKPLPQRQRTLRRRNRRQQQGGRGIQLARLALSQVGRLQQAVELKFLGILTNDTNVDYNGQIFTVNDIAQGDGDSDRVGDACMLKHVEVIIECLNDNSSTCGIRVIFFLDKQNTISTVTDLLAATGADTALTSPIVWDNRKAFKILYDFVIEVDGTYKSKCWKKFTFNTPYRVQFSAASTNITTSAIKCVYLSEVAPAAANKPRLIMSTRQLFTDL